MIFLVIIIALFAAIAFINNTQNKQKAEGNPYNKENLKQSTIDQLDDPNYQNLILPDELAEDLKNKEDKTVYFYSPRMCSLSKNNSHRCSISGRNGD